MMNQMAKLLMGVVLVAVLFYMIRTQKCQCQKEAFENKYLTSKGKEGKEGFVSNMCPTTMIKRGNKIMLYNPELAKVPGVNPIVLSSLKDYEDYVKWQRASKINCPILHLEQMYDTQGNEQYEIKSSFMIDRPNGPLNHSLPSVPKRPDINQLLNANYESNKPYNTNMYPAYDAHNQNIGQMTTLDTCGFNP